MYIPRSILVLLVISYLLYLLSADWISGPDASWYRPFVIGLIIIGIAAWSARDREPDEL